MKVWGAHVHLREVKHGTRRGVDIAYLPGLAIRRMAFPHTESVKNATLDDLVIEESMEIPS